MLLIDSKFPLVSRTLLSILADLYNVVVWMVSTRSFISKSSRPCINHLVTILRASITIGIIVTFMFHSFLITWQGRGIYPSFHSFSISHKFHYNKFHYSASSLFLLIIIRSGRLAEIILSLLLLFIFTNPSPRAVFDTRSIFMRSLTGLNSEFSFS